MRQLILFLLTFSFLFASSSQVAVSPSVKITSDYEKNFKRFWSSYIKHDSKKMYELEAPHFRYLYSFSQYKGYVDMIKIPNKVMLSKITENDGVIDAEVILEIGDKNVTTADQWIKVGRKYYHRTKVLLIFTD
jgi:hypothetical protein